jgi:hypothetical protein
MAERNRATLKSYFEAGDKPTQENFADLVDSFVSRTDDSFVTTLPDASTAQKGIARQAAIADVQAGTNSQYFVTPEGAKIAAQTFAPVTSVNGQTGAVNITATVPDASTTVKGIVQQATIADVQAGINTQLYVTPEGAKTAAQTFSPVKSVNGQTGVVNLTIPVIQDSGWVNLPLLNAFVNFGGANQTPRYRKKLGVVYVEGSIRAGANGTVIANLPAGYRPAATLVFIAATSTTAHARITVTAAGDIIGTAINTTLTSLSGITFVVE